MLFPGITPGALCDIRLKRGFGAQLAEFHLPVVIRLPFSVGLIGHCVQLVAVGQSIQRHAASALIAVFGHALQNRVLPGIAAAGDRLFGKICEEHRVMLDETGYRCYGHDEALLSYPEILPDRQCNFMHYIAK